MQNYFIRNRETDKIELHFDKATYKGLSSAERDQIKSYFTWSRQAEAWVSKARIEGGTTNAYYPEKIAKDLNLTDEGEKGERKSALDRLQDRNNRLDRKKAFYSDVDDNISIEWKQYTPSDRLSQAHNSVSFFDHNYPEAFRNEIKETISDIKTRLKVSSEYDLPTYVKTAIQRYAKAYAEYLAKYVANRTYAPSPMVVGPAKYPWHRMDKVHHRDGRNFANLDEAKRRLRLAVQKASPEAFEQRTDRPYLQNRIDEAQAQVNRMQRGVKSGKHPDYYETQLQQAKELLAYWQDQLGDVGGLQFTKQSLVDAGATHITYHSKYYPILRLSDKTVTIGKWYNDDPKITFQIPYAKVGGYLVRWEDALLPKPGEKKPKAPKIEAQFSKGDKALYVFNHFKPELVTVKSVGRKYYQVSGGYGDVAFEKLKPVSYQAQERLAAMLADADKYRDKIIDAIKHPKSKEKYDLKHFLDYGTPVYRHNVELLGLDLQTAGYPKQGGLIAFFKDKYGLKLATKTKPKGVTKSDATKIKAVKTARKKTALSKKELAIQRIANHRGVAPSAVKVAYNEDTHSYQERKLKKDVAQAQQKRKAIKTGKVATEKPKLTKEQRAEIKRLGLQDAEQALAKKKAELTPEQVIKIGKKINFDRFHMVIDGQVYSIREDFDTPMTNKRRLAPTEDNLLKWAKQPGRYDLIGVDAAGKTSVTVHKKKDKGKVPARLKVRTAGQNLKRLGRNVQLATNQDGTSKGLKKNSISRKKTTVKRKAKRTV